MLQACVGDGETIMTGTTSVRLMNLQSNGVSDRGGIGYRKSIWEIILVQIGWDSEGFLEGSEGSKGSEDSDL